MIRRLSAAALVALVAMVIAFAVRPDLSLLGFFAVQRALAGAEVHLETSGEHRLSVLVAGPSDASEIVLLHGFTGSKENWLPLMATLSDRYRVVAPDLPGWGESTRLPAADYGVVAQADRLASWLASRPRPPALLVGHSMGGHIAALVAATHPDLVPRLGLLAAAGVPFRENAFGQAVLNGEHPFAVQDRASLERYIGLVFTDPPFMPWPADQALIARRIADRGFEEVVLARIRGPERFAVQPLLPRIDAPTLLLWCVGDRVIDPSAASTYAAGLRHPRTVLLDGCGHMPMMEATEAVAHELEATLAIRPAAG